jgi:hypothetical protein
MRTSTILFASLVAATLASVPAMPAAQQPDAPTATDRVTITGWALNMSNVATGANQRIQIMINSWSTPAQREQLIKTFMDQKQDGLLRALERQPEIGRFNFPGFMGPDPNNIMRLGTDIRYARSFPGEDGGRRIVIMTPRVIGFNEARNQPRTIDYPFSLFEMHFKNDNSGEGRMAYGTQIRFDQRNNNIVLEHYASEPVRLNQLTLEVRK